MSKDGTLLGLKILLVEDEYVIARELAEALERQGAQVVGPVATLEAARALLASNKDLSGAVLDIRLHGNQSYPIAEALQRREVPFIFATGYGRQAIPQAYKDVPHCVKPTDARVIIATLARILERRADGIPG